VTGGLVDVQCVTSQNFYNDGASQTSFSTRVGTSLGYKWLVAATIPFLYNVAEVESFGQTKTARLPGFSDLSLELTRKLGITNAHTLSLGLTAPVGSYDAVRQRVVLPQRMQLGSGVLGASLTYEYTQDQDWGLLIYGGSLSYGGWENQVEDFRAPSASGYVYAGYLWGPWVPSLGLTMNGKFMGDRERGLRIEGQPMFQLSPTVGLEWSSDFFAVMLSAATPFSFSGLENWTLALGLQTSLF